ncbi:MAG: multidrug efflux SMR transporter [Planctomycetes bacterium]|nr:multidrug efflux SMR transporter [Planctomycetota bacterium]
MAWTLLLVAGMLEAVWVVGLKKSHESELVWQKLIFFGVSILSFLLMDRALKTLPAGTSYAVWTGIGAITTTIVGVLWLGESSSPLRLLCILLVVAGVVGLKWTSNRPSTAPASVTSPAAAVPGHDGDTHN